MQQWHVMGDGSLCLLRNAGEWTGRDLAAELVVKAAGWHLEYLLLEAGAIDAMTVKGIAESDELDHLFTESTRQQGSSPEETHIDRIATDPLTESDPQAEGGS